MELSIIIPVYKEASFLRKVLSKLDEQTCKKFEIVLVLDTNTENTLGVIDEFTEKFRKRIKIIFNSKRIGRTSALCSGFKILSGTYTLILNSSDKFNNKMVENILTILKNKTADIIETKMSFKHPIKIDIEMKNEIKKETKIKDKKSIIAYSSFFDFNKLYKTSLLQKVAIMPKLSVRLNSRFSGEIAYKALLHADTYQTENQVIVTSNCTLSANYNPLKSIRQFNEIISWSTAHGHGYELELRYAMYIQMTIFLFAMTGETKNKVLLKKLYDLYNAQLETNFKEFKNTNKYLMTNDKEAMILRKEHTSAMLVKLYKEFK